MDVYTQAETSQNSASSIVDGSYKTQSDENAQKLTDFSETLESFPPDIGEGPSSNYVTPKWGRGGSAKRYLIVILAG